MRSSGALFDIVNDLDCILKHAGIEKAICMGYVALSTRIWIVLLIIYRIGTIGVLRYATKQLDRGPT